MRLSKLNVPASYNYIACFLTLDCNLNCDYCINSFGKNSHDCFKKRSPVPGARWVQALNRLVTRANLPVTLQGGEPSLHPDFIWIINNLKSSLSIDILTNLCFDIDYFIANVDPLRLRRKAPYASIRASYHPSYMNLKKLIGNVLKMKRAGFSIGVYGVKHPRFTSFNNSAREKCLSAGIDFRTKEFLGYYEGKIYGNFKYPGAVGNSDKKTCLCKIPELIIGPDCSVYKCHHDLYNDYSSIGSLLDPEFVIEDKFRECSSFGECNPCDVKIKTNRFQEYGYCSADIRNIGRIKSVEKVRNDR